MFFQFCIAVKRSIGDTNGEQAMKEEKDTKIQVNPTINVCHLLCTLLFFLSYVHFFYICPDSRETFGEAKRGVKEGEGKASEDWEGNKGFL